MSFFTVNRSPSQRQLDNYSLPSPTRRTGAQPLPRSPTRCASSPTLSEFRQAVYIPAAVPTANEAFRDAPSPRFSASAPSVVLLDGEDRSCSSTPTSGGYSSSPIGTPRSFTQPAADASPGGIKRLSLYRELDEDPFAYIPRSPPSRWSTESSRPSVADKADVKVKPTLRLRGLFNRLSMTRNPGSNTPDRQTFRVQDSDVGSDPERPPQPVLIPLEPERALSRNPTPRSPQGFADAITLALNNELVDPERTDPKRVSPNTSPTRPDYTEPASRLRRETPPLPSPRTRPDTAIPFPSKPPPSSRPLPLPESIVRLLQCRSITPSQSRALPPPLKPNVRLAAGVAPPPVIPARSKLRPPPIKIIRHETDARPSATLTENEDDSEGEDTIEAVPSDACSQFAIYRAPAEPLLQPVPEESVAEKSAAASQTSGAQHGRSDGPSRIAKQGRRHRRTSSSVSIVEVPGSPSTQRTDDARASQTPARGFWAVKHRVTRLKTRLSVIGGI
ncbi:unnamed protein product [Mycena citricolor]|uniref:Uncharacterized protein n=1 Tax=Mycena citricolor TaxID=2018698 RepID=A0AAD2HSF7_9AGAR|nr:unnamed protein product [Mycena citricolor]